MGVVVQLKPQTGQYAGKTVNVYSSESRAELPPLRRLMGSLNRLHTKLSYYNMNIVSADLYPLRLALHAQFEEAQNALLRSAERVRAITAAVGGGDWNDDTEDNGYDIVPEKIDLPPTWQGIVEDIVTGQEEIMQCIHTLMPLCRKAGDAATLAMLADFADLTSESILFGRSCLGQGIEEDNASWTAECY